eukprot:7704671-Pyramimonas_sp.AAC.1
MSEVVSGSLPAGSRTGFQELMKEATRRKIRTILVENSRAVARNLAVNEEICEVARRHRINIIAADMPTLYKHNPTPTDKFLRRMVFAHTELEKDMMVHRLQS